MRGPEAIATVAQGRAAFAEYFSATEITCFHRGLATACDQAVRGSGLLLLYLISRDRSYGRHPAKPQQQSGLTPTLRALEDEGVGFELRVFEDRAQLLAALQSDRPDNKIFFFPGCSANLPFIEDGDEGASHYLLVPARGRDSHGPTILESTASVGLGHIRGVANLRLSWDTIEEAIKAYPQTTGASLDRWGTLWCLEVGSDSLGRKRMQEDLLKVILRHSCETLGDPAGKAASGLDRNLAAVIREAVQTGMPARIERASRDYIRQANFCTVHLLALVIAAELLFPGRARELRKRTEELHNAMAHTRSKYLVQERISVGPAGRAREVLLEQLAGLWISYAQAVLPIIDSLSGSLSVRAN